MYVKVCGLKESQNLSDVAQLGVNGLGFIFVESSPRNVTLTPTFAKLLREIRADKIGVFVNAPFDWVLQVVMYARLDFVQLHGNESPQFVKALKLYCKVIKAFAISDDFDFSVCEAYDDADLFLFDAKGTAAGGNGVQFNWEKLNEYEREKPFLLSGGLGPDDMEKVKQLTHPQLKGIDVNSGFEDRPGFKNKVKIKKMMEKINNKMIWDAEPLNGYYGQFGGAFIPELLHENVAALKKAFYAAKSDPGFDMEYRDLLRDYVGRPTPLYLAGRLSKKHHATIYLKREDLNHTGAHKINNTIGQILLAKRMGKTEIIAETGAGQHGVATATVCALMGLNCIVYMGAKDMERQAPNVGRMRLLGAEVRPATCGSQTLKDATNEAIRHWINAPDAFYIIGSVVGPHPYPEMVAYFQSVISEEIQKQLMITTGKSDPDMVIACVGGGSNAAGAFYHYISTDDVELVAVEAAGYGVHSGKSAATSFLGTTGVIHGAKTLMMQTQDGQIIEPHSISAGLDYPGIGPLHAHLIEEGRVKAVAVTDREALEAGKELMQLEGIIPALESAHALAALSHLSIEGKTIVLNLSGRGDKDLETYLKTINHEASTVK